MTRPYEGLGVLRPELYCVQFPELSPAVEDFSRFQGGLSRAIPSSFQRYVTPHTSSDVGRAKCALTVKLIVPR